MSSLGESKREDVSATPVISLRGTLSSNAGNAVSTYVLAVDSIADQLSLAEAIGQLASQHNGENDVLMSTEARW